MNKFSDIIVVGAGPAGLSFAAEFKNSNIKVTMIEKSDEKMIQDPPFDAREIALTHPSKNILEHLGIWQNINQENIYILKEAKVIDGNSPFQLYFEQPSKNSSKKLENLGFLIPNHLIRKSAYEVVKEMSNVEFLTNTMLKSINKKDDFMEITLDNDHTINCRLIVCADSRFSTTRQMLGIPTSMYNFARTVITFRMEHIKENHQTALECFHYGRTLAILPLSSHLSNMVITIDSNKVDSILNLTPEELAYDIYEQTRGQLGILKLASSIHTYPLIATHAVKFYGYKSAIIGDASVGMHPVTAHGFNLGLYGTHLLAKLILKAENKGQDIGSLDLLQEYNFKHMLKTRPLFYGTNAIVKLFTTESQPAKFTRTVVMRMSDHLPLLKKIISKQLTG